MSSSNRVSITAIEEAVYGVTPSNGMFQTARFVSESLSGTPKTAKSTEIHSDRKASGQVQVGLEVGGDIKSELSADPLLKDFVRAAMMQKQTEKAADITGVDIQVKAIDKTLTFSAAIDLVKGDLIFMSEFTNAKNNGMAYVRNVEFVEQVPAIIAPKITATPAGPTTDVDNNPVPAVPYKFSFAIAGGADGVWSYGDADSTSDADGVFTYPGAGKFTVTFTDDTDGYVSTLSLQADTPIVQTGTVDEIAVPAEGDYVVTVGKETIADETYTVPVTPPETPPADDAPAEPVPTISKYQKLSVGKDVVSFSMEKQFQDLTDKAIDYRGMLVNTMSIDMKYGAIADASFGFMGNGYETPELLMTASRQVREASTCQPINASSDVGSVFIDGEIAQFCVQNLKIDLANGLNPQECMGTLAPRGYALGTAAVTVSGSAYLADSNWDLMQKKLTQQPVSIAYMAGNEDGGIAVIVHGAQLTFPDPGAKQMDTQVSIDFSGSAKNTENGYLDIYFY